MGWAFCGTDKYGRRIGYGVEAYCDHPNCNIKIDRGLGCVCGNMHGGDNYGCGKYFCGNHLFMAMCPDGKIYQLCEECYNWLKKEGEILPFFSEDEEAELK